MKGGPLGYVPSPTRQFARFVKQGCLVLGFLRLPLADALLPCSHGFNAGQQQANKRTTVRLDQIRYMVDIR